MMKRWILAAALGIMAVAVIAVGVFVNAGIPVQVAPVQRGEVREYIDEQGKTRVPRVYRISTPQAGRIRDITLSEGDRVEQDAVVAQFIDVDLENAVAEARAVVEQLEAAIAENDDVSVEQSVAAQAAEFVESMDNTVGAAKAQMEASSKRAAYAETTLGRAQRLFQSGAGTEEELDRATLQFWEGQLGYRQDTLTVEAITSIRAATALLPKMVADYIRRKGLRRAVLEKERAEAEARLRQVTLERDRGTMRSPVEGVILERLVENEQYLPAGTELLTIGQLDRLQVESDVLSQDVVRIRRGDPVEVYGPAVGGGLGEGVPGQVDHVYPAGFTKISSLGVEQQRVKVIVTFDAEVIQKLLQQQVGVDYRVRVRIYSQKQTNALFVPRSSLFRGPDGQWHVFVAGTRRARLKRVSLGLMNDTVAEVTTGLSESDHVVLAPETSLTHGARIKPIPR